MKKSRVYTKTGDKGTTSLVGGARVPKNHIRLDAYGTIDELNSFLGLLRAQGIADNDKENILKIQNTLFIVGGILATEDDKNPGMSPYHITVGDVEWIEALIDEADNELPSLSSFVIPSGYQPAAICHVCRTVCRRAERIIYTLSEQVFVPDLILIYVNRLSDYLFVLSRKISAGLDKEEFFDNNNCR